MPTKDKDHKKKIIKKKNQTNNKTRRGKEKKRGKGDKSEQNSNSDLPMFHMPLPAERRDHPNRTPPIAAGILSLACLRYVGLSAP